MGNTGLFTGGWRSNFTYDYIALLFWRNLFSHVKRLWERPGGRKCKKGWSGWLRLPDEATAGRHGGLAVVRIQGDDLDELQDVSHMRLQQRNVRWKKKKQQSDKYTDWLIDQLIHYSAIFSIQGYVALDRNPGSGYDTLLLRLIPGNLYCVCPHKQFYTLYNILDCRAALQNSGMRTDNMKKLWKCWKH